MAKKKEQVNFVTELLSDMKRRLIICRIALVVSLASNVVMAAIWFMR